MAGPSTRSLGFRADDETTRAGTNPLPQRNKTRAYSRRTRRLSGRMVAASGRSGIGPRTLARQVMTSTARSGPSTPFKRSYLVAKSLMDLPPVDVRPRQIPRSIWISCPVHGSVGGTVRGGRADVHAGRDHVFGAPVIMLSEHWADICQLTALSMTVRLCAISNATGAQSIPNALPTPAATASMMSGKRRLG